MYSYALSHYKKSTKTTRTLSHHWLGDRELESDGEDLADLEDAQEDQLSQLDRGARAFVVALQDLREMWNAPWWPDGVFDHYCRGPG